MLDVHAPEHNIGGVRDFLIHLLTITVGLLIALGLENAVEAMHHRHQRKEAEAMIRQEIRENEKLIEDSEAQFKQELDGMNTVLASLEMVTQGKKPTFEEKSFVFHQSPMQDAAWRTAASTGALSYMEYGQVERFSDAYKEQDQLDAMSKQTLNDYLELMPILSHHVGDIDAVRAKEALVYARHAVAHLNGMYFIAVGTLGSYKEALK
ncbi:MAG: hypothetical protein V4555_06950 [Acidobacteriota bacterium]